MKLTRYMCRYVSDLGGVGRWVEVDAETQGEAALHLLSRIHVEAVPMTDSQKYGLADVATAQEDGEHDG